MRIFRIIPVITLCGADDSVFGRKLLKVSIGSLDGQMHIQSHHPKRDTAHEVK